MLLLLLLSSSSMATSLAARGPSDDCILDLAVVCLDDRLLVYVNWLEKRDRLNVVGDIVTIVKKPAADRHAEDRSRPSPLPTDDKRPQHKQDGTALGPAIDEYFGTHALRISLPWILDEDIDLTLDQQGRGKKSKMKNLKKMMSMLGVIMCAKLSLMGPMALMMIGAKAVKALLLAAVSLTISKMMLMKKLKGGGGGGGSGGSIYQAEWLTDKDDRNAHLLAYAGQPTEAGVVSHSSLQHTQPNAAVYPTYEPQGYRHGTVQ